MGINFSFEEIVETLAERTIMEFCKHNGLLGKCMAIFNEMNEVDLYFLFRKLVKIALKQHDAEGEIEDHLKPFVEQLKGVVKNG